MEYYSVKKMKWNLAICYYVDGARLHYIMLKEIRISELSLKMKSVGIPGWCSGLAPAFGPCHDPGDPGSNPTSDSQCTEPASPSACVSASLSVTIIKKKLKKEVKHRATLWFQNFRARYLPQGYKSRLVDSKWDTQPSVCSNVINNSQTVDTAQMSIGRWMGRKMW